jgi:hypothetical protein
LNDDTLRDAYERNGRNAAATARELGVAVSTLKDRLAKERSPFAVTGRSTLRDAEGNVVMEWEKTSTDKAREREALEAAYEALSRQTPQAICQSKLHRHARRISARSIRISIITSECSPGTARAATTGI